MKCAESLELLVHYDSGSLASEEREALAGHLEECAGCRHEVNALTRLWDVLGAWSDVEPGPSLAAGLMARVGDGSAQVDSAWQMLDLWSDIEPSPYFTSTVMHRVSSTPAPVRKRIYIPEIPYGVSHASTKDQTCAAVGVSGHKEARGNASFRGMLRGLSSVISARYVRSFATLAAAAIMIVCVMWLSHPPAGMHAPVTAPVVQSWEVAPNAATHEDLTGAGERILDVLKDPSTNTRVDDVVEEMLKEHSDEG